MPRASRKVNDLRALSSAVHAVVGSLSDTVAAVRLPRPRSTRRRRPPLTALATVLCAVAVGGCAGTELEVQPEFDGVWVVARLQVDGIELDVDRSAPIIEIDTAEAAVRGSTGCGRLFGSYTLTVIDDGDQQGRASFTIPSPTPGDNCADADRQRHESLVAGLESVSRWRREPTALFLLDDPTTVLELRPAG